MPVAGCGSLGGRRLVTVRVPVDVTRMPSDGDHETARVDQASIERDEQASGDGAGADLADTGFARETVGQAGGERRLTANGGNTKPGTSRHGDGNGENRRRHGLHLRRRPMTARRAECG